MCWRLNLFSPFPRSVFAPGPCYVVCVYTGVMETRSLAVLAGTHISGLCGRSVQDFRALWPISPGFLGSGADQSRISELRKKCCRRASAVLAWIYQPPGPLVWVFKKSWFPARVGVSWICQRAYGASWPVVVPGGEIFWLWRVRLLGRPFLDAVVAIRQADKEV